MIASKNNNYRLHLITRFLINGQSLGTSVVEIDEQRLVVRDQYGFYLIFSYPEQTLYDESADVSYKLTSEK